MQCLNCKKECMESELTNGLCNECAKKYGNTIITKNKVAQKYKSIIHVIWILGYGLSILLFIIGAINNELLTGIIVGLILAVSTWYGSLSLEYKAGVLQLLEDIKNK